MHETPFLDRQPAMQDMQVSRVRVFQPRPPPAPGEFEGRMSRRFDIEMFDRSLFASVNTLYKRKDQKVLPVNEAKKHSNGPGGEVRWKAAVLEKEQETLRNRVPSRWDTWLIPRFAQTPERTRLTSEREQALDIGQELKPEEREMLIQVLKNREMALAWDFSEIGRIRAEVTPPQEIHTVEHKPWRAVNFSVLKTLQQTVCDMLRERLDRGILEYCDGPYRNPWFLVAKKNGKYRLINATMNINKVTIKNANLLPSVDKFAE